MVAGRHDQRNRSSPAEEGCFAGLLTQPGRLAQGWKMHGRLASGSVCLALVSTTLVACAGATPAASSPSGETAVVNVDAVTPPVAGKGDKPGDKVTSGATVDPHIARKAAIEEAMEHGMIGLLGGGSGEAGEAFGGLIGTGGGQAFGAGGLGLSGIGSGAGGASFGGGGTGAGIGLGSIGTIGRGSGGGMVGGMVGGYGYSGTGPSGASVNVSGGVVVELGDSSTLGITLEQASRVMRDRVTAMRGCYLTSLKGHPQRAGSVSLRLVVGSDGRVQFVRVFASDLGDKEAHDCLTKAMKEAYVGVATGGFYGVIETVVSFRQAPKS